MYILMCIWKLDYNGVIWPSDRLHFLNPLHLHVNILQMQMHYLHDMVIQLPTNQPIVSV